MYAMKFNQKTKHEIKFVYWSENSDSACFYPSFACMYINWKFYSLNMLSPKNMRDFSFLYYFSFSSKIFFFFSMYFFLVCMLPYKNFFVITNPPQKNNFYKKITNPRKSPPPLFPPVLCTLVFPMCIFTMYFNVLCF